MRVLQTANGEVVALAFSASGDALAAVVQTEGVVLWNLQLGDHSITLDDSISQHLSTFRILLHVMHGQYCVDAHADDEDRE